MIKNVLVFVDKSGSIGKEQIMTDGYAPFPDETSANEIPVLWVLVESQVMVPWGRSIRINET